MFNCYLHGWSSQHSMCPICPGAVSNSSEVIDLGEPDSLKGTFADQLAQKDAELSALREENEKLKSDLKTEMEVNGKYITEERKTLKAVVERAEEKFKQCAILTGLSECDEDYLRVMVKASAPGEPSEGLGRCSAIVLFIREALADIERLRGS